MTSFIYLQYILFSLLITCVLTNARFDDSWYSQETKQKCFWIGAKSGNLEEALRWKRAGATTEGDVGYFVSTKIRKALFSRNPDKRNRVASVVLRIIPDNSERDKHVTEIGFDPNARLPDGSSIIDYAIIKDHCFTLQKILLDPRVSKETIEHALSIKPINDMPSLAPNMLENHYRRFF